MGAFPTVDEHAKRADNARKAALDRVMAEVRRGVRPSLAFSADDLAWLLGESAEVEVRRLDEQADANLADRRARALQSKRADELAHEVELVKREWAKQQGAELDQRAIVEARKRLKAQGWSEDE